MTKTPCYVLRKLLADNGLVVIPGAKPVADWTAYIDSLPANPNKLVCLYDTAGTPQGREMRTGVRFYRPGFVISLRGDPNDQSAVRSKGEDVQQFLDQINNTQVVIGSSSFTIQCVSSTIPLIPNGQEVGSQARWLYSINGLLTVWED